jgi:gas vesicle protein
MNRRTEDTLSMLAGAGIGALAMFLLDPSCGQRRRHQLAAASREAWDTAGETVGPLVSNVAQGASRLGRNIADTVGDYSSSAYEAGEEFFSDAGEAISRGASSLGESISDTSGRMWGRGKRRARKAGRTLSDRSSSMWHRGREMVGAEEKYRLPVVPTTLGGLGLFAMGAGAIYLLDPDQGEARRHWLRDKTFSLLKDAGDLCRKTGRHIANQTYGTYAETRARWNEEEVTDEQLVARVRSELGRVVSNMSNVHVTAINGYVTLSGTIPQDEIRPAEESARSVRGVAGVNALLQPQTQQPQS